MHRILLPTLALALSGCLYPQPPLGAAIETQTERVRCELWGKSLPSRSQQDTPQTKAEIGLAYDVFESLCPGFALGPAGGLEAGLK